MTPLTSASSATMHFGTLIPTLFTASSSSSSGAAVSQEESGGDLQPSLSRSGHSHDGGGGGDTSFMAEMEEEGCDERDASESDSVGSHAAIFTPLQEIPESRTPQDKSDEI